MVPRRAPNLQDLLFRRKTFSLNNSSGRPPDNNPCGRNHCRTCNLMADLQMRGSRVASEGGTCINKNCIYTAQCQICVINNIQAIYMWVATTTPLSVRISGHRFGYNDINVFRDKDNVTNKNCLWAHLNLAHGLNERSDFGKVSNSVFLKPLIQKPSQSMNNSSLKSLIHYSLTD